ncbi:SIS domain-containing protein [Oceanispirochaeta crateris]|uniref:SIS domain-containing protein n=1 Tax=Oceanispirochaeta crateris TaxID=2518645 RepID=A0A5C1QQB0_9SPIO|nr:SIS domain-containing protein [Oceanispirochaeta crateris]QEN09160.1 SIS domain-containing protein [Oceanispirochaeta crateris]
MKLSSWGYAKESFTIESNAIKQTFKAINKTAFEKAVDVLSKAERIAASGCGHSGIACQHFAHLMCCIELPARFISPSEAVHGASGFLKKGDVIILASRGGKTSELLPIMQICKNKEVTVISITENMESPLSLGSDIVIKMHVQRETDKYNSQGTTSFVVLSVIFDSLQAALIEEIDYQEKQFALIHPGGAVGEKLNR